MFGETLIGAKTIENLYFTHCWSTRRKKRPILYALTKNPILHENRCGYTESEADGSIETNFFKKGKRKRVESIYLLDDFPVLMYGYKYL